MEYLKIFITIVVALVGWVIAHKFTSSRDLKNKKRETKLNLLIKSYESIALWLSEPKGDETLKDLVNALILVQCYGSLKQVEMARKSMKSIANRDGCVKELGNLICLLRDDFREEIELTSDGEPVATIHFTKS